MEEPHEKILNEADAKKELILALEKSGDNSMPDSSVLIIKDSAAAINLAEPILFRGYGKEHILKQKPYEIFLINKHWIISGTLPKGFDGGTFLIIVNATNGKVIKITHGK